MAAIILAVIAAIWGAWELLDRIEAHRTARDFENGR